MATKTKKPTINPLINKLINKLAISAPAPTETKPVAQDVAAKPKTNTTTSGGASPLNANNEFQTSVKFNPNGVEYGIGGKMYNLTTSEYNAMQGKAGSMTDQVREIIKTKQALAELSAGAKNAANKNLKLDLISRGGAEPNQLLTQSVDEQLAAMPSQNGKGEGLVLGGATELLGAGLEAAKRNPAMSQELQSAAKVIDQVGGLVGSVTGLSTGGKRQTASVTKAAGSFTDASNILTEQAAQIAAGGGDEDAAIRQVEQALNSIKRLEAQTHGFNMANTNYWIDQGAELEVMIANEKMILEGKKVDLLVAIQRKKAAQYGL